MLSAVRFCLAFRYIDETIVQFNTCNDENTCLYSHIDVGGCDDGLPQNGEYCSRRGQ